MEAPWFDGSAPMMMTLPSMAGVHVAVVSSRNFILLTALELPSPMMMALNLMKSSVDIARHCASETTLLVNPKAVARTSSLLLSPSTKRRSSALTTEAKRLVTAPAARADTLEIRIGCSSIHLWVES
jgi:hypothetical protein